MAGRFLSGPGDLVILANNSSLAGRLSALQKMARPFLCHSGFIGTIPKAETILGGGYFENFYCQLK
jgi:hypothetical protein